VTVALLSLLYTQGEGHKRKGETKYSAWSLGCPVVRRCPSGRKEAELCYLVMGVTAWTGKAVHLGSLGDSSK
jgi:hypothetical protein